MLIVFASSSRLPDLNALSTVIVIAKGKGGRATAAAAQRPIVVPFEPAPIP